MRVPRANPFQGLLTALIINLMFLVSTFLLLKFGRQRTRYVDWVPLVRLIRALEITASNSNCVERASQEGRLQSKGEESEEVGLEEAFFGMLLQVCTRGLPW